VIKLHEFKWLNVFTKHYVDSIYIGQFKNEMREGLGIMMYKNGRIYEGHWMRDWREGEGFEIYSNGNVYSGYFRLGKADGKGVY